MDWAQVIFIIDQLSKKLDKIQEDLDKIKEKLEIDED